jgi:predicted metal-dependent phosphotriesterase family hydrolase
MKKKNVLQNQIINLSVLPTRMIPILHEKDVKDKQIQMMTFENPKKIFS